MRARGALLDRVDEVAVLAVADLEHDAAGAAADHRPALPQPLAHGEAEALAQRLLHHDVGDALERVDLHRCRPAGCSRAGGCRGRRRAPPRPAPTRGSPRGRRSPSSPASTSCASGTFSRTMRNASITPTGSFHGSKRLTWHTIGRSDVDAVLAADLLDERHRAGRGSSPRAGRCTAARARRGPCRATSGTNSGIVHTDASYCSTNGRKNSQHVGVRVGEVDVAAPDPLGVRAVARPSRATKLAHRGRLRVVDDDVVPLALEQRARCRAPARGRRAASCAVHSTSAPWSALCTALVTAKNSSLPWITCHSASMPRSRSSGTWVASSSATPPP